MRYTAQHKIETRRKIVSDAARRVRAEGMTGAAVSAVMRDAGLTHGGFYKHFSSKDDLLLESLREAFADIADRLVQAARNSPPRTAWKTIVNIYLSPEHCAHPEVGCPLAALGPELARAGQATKSQIFAEMSNYEARLLPFMPGRRTADKRRSFLMIFSTMIGAITLARMIPDAASRAEVLATARNQLLRTFK